MLKTMMKRRTGVSLCLGVWLLGAGGCADKADSVDVVTLEGKIDKIERISPKTGKLTVVYFSDKHGQEMVGIGDVTEETEILIDGAVATLADIRVGERLRGEVRIDQVHGEERKTVMKIRIERAKPIGMGSVTIP